VYCRLGNSKADPLIDIFRDVYNCYRLREATAFAVFAGIEIGLPIRVLVKDLLFREVSCHKKNADTLSVAESISDVETKVKPDILLWQPRDNNSRAVS